MSINGRRPFTEMYEVAQNELVREAAQNQDDKYKGFINQAYINELPKILPEKFIKKEAFITTLSEYTTGTVTVGSGTTGVPGVGTTFTSVYTNSFIRVDGYNRLYRVSFSADTLMTFQNSLSWIESSGTGLSYSLFQDRYQLPSDFAYMWEDDVDDPNAVSRYVSNAQLFLTPLENDAFQRQFTGVIGDLWAYTIKWQSEVPYIVFLSAPSVADFIKFEYIPQLTTLTEYTTGTVTFANTTAVIASGALWTANVNTAVNTYYIRNDADGTGSSSKWYRILTVSNNTAITLSDTFGGTTGAAQTYTISETSKWPPRFDDAIIYKAALIADPDEVQGKKWAALYQEATSNDKMADGKRTHTRSFKTFFGTRKRT